MANRQIIILVVILILDLNFGRQKYNTNTDFLIHEAQVNPQPPAKEYPVSQGFEANSGSIKKTQETSVNNHYIAQFPPLNPARGTISQGSPNSSSYIHTGIIRQTQSPSGKRDYIASQFPSLSPTSTLNTPNPNLSFFTTRPPTSGKRDYVAPQIKPGQGNTQQTGKVKDLVNFFDNKPNEPKKPNGVSSYSSILQGSTSNNKQNSNVITSSTTHPALITSPTAIQKPLNVGPVNAGSNKPSTTPTTSKPMSPTNTYRKPIQSGNAFTSRPGVQKPGSAGPSNTVVNNNKNQNSVTDTELQTLSEELLQKDSNNAAKYVTVNYQEKTSSQSKDDKAPLPLLTVSQDAWNIPTIQKFLPLLDNYERDTLVNEYVTPQERNEENIFMDAIMSTSVIRHLLNFLKEKGYVTPDPRQQRDFLKQLWFSLYSRGKGKISSSGFEHVFVSELKNGEVSGLHNWIYFSKEELANRANYLGYLKYEQLSDKGVVMKLHFNQQGVDKPVDSIFIGTSPELEIALYTLCFVTRADQDCKLKLSNKDVEIVTHTFRYRSKNLIGSAYPQI